MIEKVDGKVATIIYDGFDNTWLWNGDRLVIAQEKDTPNKGYFGIKTVEDAYKKLTDELYFWYIGERECKEAFETGVFHVLGIDKEYTIPKRNSFYFNIEGNQVVVHYTPKEVLINDKIVYQKLEVDPELHASNLIDFIISRIYNNYHHIDCGVMKEYSQEEKDKFFDDMRELTGDVNYIDMYLIMAQEFLALYEDALKRRKEQQG